LQNRLDFQRRTEYVEALPLLVAIDDRFQSFSSPFIQPSLCWPVATSQYGSQACMSNISMQLASLRLLLDCNARCKRLWMRVNEFFGV